MDFLILNPRSQATLAGGSFTIIGGRTTGETVTLIEPLQGSLIVNFDPSFNAGGDTIAFLGNPEDYTIRLSGSSVIISGGPITATIPVGFNDTNIRFLGDGSPGQAETRVLSADLPSTPGGAPVITLGSQVIVPGAPATLILPPMASEEAEPAFTGSFSRSVAENQTAAFDADLVGNPAAVFALSGTDSALFAINQQTGVVTFRAAPDFEMPADAGANNVYNLTVSATVAGQTISQAVAITVTNVAEQTAGPVPQVVTIATGLRDAIAPTMSEANDAGRLNAAGDIVTAFGVTPAVTGRVGASTELANLAPTTRLIISGENQTVGEGNNDADQRFGTITVADSTAQDLLIELANTARVTGQLTLDALIISGDASTVDALTLNSGGTRDTTNAIRALSALEVRDVVLTGTQALGVVIDTIAGGPNRDLAITGAMLEGTLALGLNGAELDGGDDDTITGTSGDVDRLALFGVLGGGTGPTIADIEFIQFGTVRPSAFGDATQSAARTVRGVFSFANVSDIANPIIVTNLSGALRLTDLSGDTVINVGDDTAGAAAPVAQLNPAVNQALTFAGAGDADDAITVNFTPLIGELSDLLLVFGDLLDPTPSTQDFIAISGFGDVSLDFARLAELGDDFFFAVVDLRLDNAAGIDLDAAGLTLSGAAARLTSDGGAQFDAVRVDRLIDQLTITGGAINTEDQIDVSNAILGSISVIDISGFHGTFFGEVVNAVSVNGTAVTSANVDRTFIIGDDDVFITLQPFSNPGPDDAEVIDTNTIFRFTDGTPTSGDVDGTASWVIDNFVYNDDDGSSIVNGGLSNFSVLDFSGLGLTSSTQLSIAQDGADTVITTNGGAWEIVLTNTDAGELRSNSENFRFVGANGSAADAAVMIDSFAFA